MRPPVRRGGRSVLLHRHVDTSPFLTPTPQNASLKRSYSRANETFPVYSARVARNRRGPAHTPVDQMRDSLSRPAPARVSPVVCRGWCLPAAAQRGVGSIDVADAEQLVDP
jgi:hypothetical protein